MKSTQTLFTVFLTALFVVACSSEPDQKQTHIEGQITVDSEIDPYGDFSGIELLVAFQDREGELRDTLFHSVTDSLGNFSGTATIDERSIYPVVVSRGGNIVGVINMVLADSDSIEFNAELPDLPNTATVSSRENDAYEVYERLERSFNRVALFINAGRIGSDEVEDELQKWSDLYWSLYEDRHGTLAAENSASSSLSLLQGWNDELMMQRVDTLLTKDQYLPETARQLALQYHADSEGLDRALSFLDELEQLSTSDLESQRLKMQRIEILYDSARTEEATEHLNRFKADFADNEAAMEWADNITYDLDMLSPGQPFPDFELETTTGDVVSNESLKGSPFMIEITRFDNPLYQEQFERTIAIHQIYNSFGLEVVTVPVSTSQTALDAFFDERSRLWSVVQPGTFDAEEFLDLYNVNQLPTRFLINDNGEIIRRYIGTEYDDIVRGLQQILTQQETES